MTKDPFAAYKLPLGLTEGVDISLDGTPAVFRVALPSSMNEGFSVDLMVRMSEDGSFDKGVNGAKFQAARKNLFFDTCILSATGLPDGMDHAEFFETYPMAKRVVFERAMELSDVADKEVNDAMEKLKPTPNGKSSGVGAPVNTKTSSKRASNQQPASQTSVA